MTKSIIKALLYPGFTRNKVDTRHVRLRREHRTQSLRRRRSICSSTDLSQCVSSAVDGDDGASVTSSVGFVHYFDAKTSKASATSSGTFVDHGSGVAADCTRDIFALFKQSDGKYMPITRDSEGRILIAHQLPVSESPQQYYPISTRVQSGRAESVIHTSTAELVIGPGRNGRVTPRRRCPTEEMSDASELHPMRTNIACVDLVNVDDSLQMKSDKISKDMVDERHSMPTLFVGNRFNCSSLTEVFIPSYRDRREIKPAVEPSTAPVLLAENAVQHCSELSLATSTTTHSSILDIPAVIPAPDQMQAELLYNSAEAQEIDDQFVIKPPSMFDCRRSHSKDYSPLNAKRNSNKSVVTRQSISPMKDKRVITYHHLTLERDDLRSADSKEERKSTLSTTRKCGCCVSSPCRSPRSSDSGMAGSYTISSPDAPIINTENEYEQFIDDFLNTNQMDRLNSGLMHSQSTHNFGRFDGQSFGDAMIVDTSHDSGQYGHCNYDSETGGGDKTSTSARASTVNNDLRKSPTNRDSIKRQSRCQSAERSSEQETTHSPPRGPIFKSGMYAHWWRKEALPTNVLREIYELKNARKPSPDHQSSATGMRHANRSIDSSWGSGKPHTHTYTQPRFLCVFCVDFVVLPLAVRCISQHLMCCIASFTFHSNSFQFILWTIIKLIRKLNHFIRFDSPPKKNIIFCSYQITLAVTKNA